MNTFQSLIRNRRGAVCAVIVGLLFTLGMILGTWSARCFLDGALHPLPDGTTGLVLAFLGTQFFKYRDDRKAGEGFPAPPTA